MTSLPFHQSFYIAIRLLVSDEAPAADLQVEHVDRGAVGCGLPEHSPDPAGDGLPAAGGQDTADQDVSCSS